METPKNHVIVIDLHGSKARRGVDLDGLQLFLENFRRTLREFERVSSRRSPVPRTGRPDTAAGLASAFRLIRFEVGSGIATLEPAAPAAGSSQLPLPDVASAATANLEGLLEAIDGRGELDDSVLDALEGSRRALGDDGSFGVCVASRGRSVVDAESLQRLRKQVQCLTDEPLTVSGRVHLIEIEEPSKVAIRATDGTDWICVYRPELEPRVLGLVKQLVWARGTGARTSTGRGRMQLETIDPVPVHVQATLFSERQREATELANEQGVAGPQGLASTTDPEWADDEAGDRFLSFVMATDR